MDEATTTLCKKAIRHTLQRIKDNPRVQYELGAGTETYELLTAAAAALWGEPVDKVRDHHLPGSAAIHGGRS